PQEVTGRVTEQSFGDVLPSVHVALLDSAGTQLRWMLTDAEGRFRLAVEPGVTYRLSVARLGFHTRETEPFTVGPDETREMDIRLEINPVELEPMLVQQRASRVSSGRELVQRHQLLGKGVILSGAAIMAADPHYTLDAFRPVEGIMVNGSDLIAMRGPYRCLKFLHNNLPLRHERGYNDILPRDIAAVEIYREFAEVPTDLRFEALEEDRETGEVRHCGLVNMWTKGAW
ncbi:MAG: carboxypeptidase-like regulatory domain-containing protein, partial [Gemmatimonadota bacterium]